MGTARKKKFHELSIAAQFHTAPKIFGEEAEYPFNEELNDIMLNARRDVSECVENKTRLETSEGIHMQEVIQNILSTELNDEAKNDPEEQRKLKHAKEKIMIFTTNVIDSIENYMNAILSSGETRNFDKNKDKIASSDDKRKQCHNTLIDNINILNRCLTWWFSDFDPGNLPDAQMDMYKKQEEKYITYDIERTNIPFNGIVSDSYNIKERRDITIWAQEIYKDLSSIQKLNGTID